MKILGINGSQRREGNSYLLLKSALEGAKKEDDKLIETEILQLRDFEIKPCEAHYSGLHEAKNWGCGKEPYKCILKDDFEAVFQKMINADGIIIVSPFYYPVPAKLAGSPEAYRAVGNILNKNQDLYPPKFSKKTLAGKIPCHRIIKSDGRIGGYNKGVREKVVLLKKEGVKIEEGERNGREKHPMQKGRFFKQIFERCA